MWLVGEGVLHDPYACIGHRFRTEFSGYSIRSTAVPINKLRMARKNFGERAWDEWLRQFRLQHAEAEWDAVWTGFWKRWRSVERERRRLIATRKRDEYWYASHFGLPWPQV
jgi:hypothetical protein